MTTSWTCACRQVGDDLLRSGGIGGAGVQVVEARRVGPLGQHVQQRRGRVDEDRFAGLGAVLDLGDDVAADRSPSPRVRADRWRTARRSIATVRRRQGGLAPGHGGHEQHQRSRRGSAARRPVRSRSRHHCADHQQQRRRPVQVQRVHARVLGQKTGRRRPAGTSAVGVSDGATGEPGAARPEHASGHEQRQLGRREQAGLVDRADEAAEQARPGRPGRPAVARATTQREGRKGRQRQDHLRRASVAAARSAPRSDDRGQDENARVLLEQIRRAGGQAAGQEPARSTADGVRHQAASKANSVLSQPGCGSQRSGAVVQSDQQKQARRRRPSSELRTSGLARTYISSARAARASNDERARRQDVRPAEGPEQRRVQVQQPGCVQR